MNSSAKGIGGVYCISKISSTKLASQRWVVPEQQLAGQRASGG